MSTLMKRFARYFGNSRSERGAILFIVAASLVVLLGFMGLAIDLGHAYNNKSQLQNIADACALAGGSALNGSAAGIDLAASRATDALNRLDNKTEFNSQSVSIPEGNISFSTALSGPWSDRATAGGIAANIKYVRVVVPPQSSELYFAKIIPGIPSVLNIGAEAVAGLLPQTEVCSALDPFAAVALDNTDTPSTPGPTGGHFGFRVGQVYSLLRRSVPGTPSEGTCEGTPGSGCSACSDAVAEDPVNVCGVASVAVDFGLSNPTSSNTRCFRDLIMNGSRDWCVELGKVLETDPGSGDINVESALQERYCQDSVTSPNITFQDYMSQKQTSPGPNRRVVRVAISHHFPCGPPYCTQQRPYAVEGFGCFFMRKCPKVNPPSGAICMEYVGRCDNNGNANPAGNGGGASISRLVLFR